MISHSGSVIMELQPSNCLLCGELDEIGNNVSVFDCGEDISVENARRVCKLLKLPYQDNATVLRGLRTCNFCRDCKNDIVRFDSFVCQLESLKSNVDHVKEGFMEHLQLAQDENYDGVCTDEAALKTAETRKYLRECLGIFQTEEQVEQNLEPNGIDDQAQNDDDDNEDDGFSFKIVDVRGGTDVEFCPDEPQEVAAAALVQVGAEDHNGAMPEAGPSFQNHVGPAQNHVQNTSGGSDSVTLIDITSENGYDEHEQSEDSADQMDLELQFLVPPDLSCSEEEEEGRMDQDPLKIFDDDYDEEGQAAAEEPEVSRGGNGAETSYQLASNWYHEHKQDAGVHFLVQQDQMAVVRSSVGQSLLTSSFRKSPKASQEPKLLNWSDLRAAVSPSCYRIYKEPDGTKKLKLTGKMTFEAIKQRVAAYRMKRDQEFLQLVQGVSGSGSESSFCDSASNSPTEGQIKQRKSKFRGIPHQNNERRRRAELAHSFEALRKLVPTLSARRSSGQKLSKVAILAGAREYCEVMKNMERQQEKELTKLEARSKELKRKLGLQKFGTVSFNQSLTTSTPNHPPPPPYPY